MIAADIPPDDEARVHRLQDLAVLDTPPEPMLDLFTRLAADIADHPIALISLVDQDRQWFKAAHGTSQGGQSPREQSFCGHAIVGTGVFEVEDARCDPRFHDNPAVTGEPKVVHYAGAPLRMPGGEHIGTLCLVDHQPRRLSPRQRKLLEGLAQAVAMALLMREQSLNDQRQIERRESLLRMTLEHLPQGVMVFSASGQLRLHNARAQAMLDYPNHLMRGPGATLNHMTQFDAMRGQLGAGDPQALAARRLAHAMAPGARQSERVRPDGTVLEIQGHPLGDQGQVVVLSDITPHRRLERDLRRGQLRLEQALDATALGLWEYDVATDVVHLFETWGPLFGFPRGERNLPLKALGDLVPHYAWHLWERGLRALIMGQTDHLSIEHEMIDGSGRKAWIASEAKVAERDGRGWVLRLIGTSKNVTERARLPLDGPAPIGRSDTPCIPA